MNINISEKGLITFSVVVACTALILAGHDTVIGYTMLSVVCGYYGITITLPVIGRKRRNK